LALWHELSNVKDQLRIFWLLFDLLELFKAGVVVHLGGVDVVGYTAVAYLDSL